MLSLKNVKALILAAKDCCGHVQQKTQAMLLEIIWKRQGKTTPFSDNNVINYSGLLVAAFLLQIQTQQQGNTSSA